MEKKKSAKADLETKRTVYLEIGFILVLAMVFFAFEYKSYDSVEYNYMSSETSDLIEEHSPITLQKVKRPPPPIQAPTINLVDSKVDVINIIDIPDFFDDETPSGEYIYEPMVEDIPDDTPFITVEQMPEFKGGLKEMYKFIGNIIEYPRMAIETSVSGRVFLTFVVERDGSTTDVQLVRGIGFGCDEEAIRVINAMPRWNPGKQRGNPVRVQFQMPIKFTLQ